MATKKGLSGGRNTFGPCKACEGILDLRTRSAERIGSGGDPVLFKEFVLWCVQCEKAFPRRFNG